MYCLCIIYYLIVTYLLHYHLSSIRLVPDLFPALLRQLADTNQTGCHFFFELILLAREQALWVGPRRSGKNDVTSHLYRLVHALRMCLQHKKTKKYLTNICRDSEAIIRIASMHNTVQIFLHNKRGTPRVPSLLRVYELIPKLLGYRPSHKLFEKTER
jgi:hypothetical protein